MASKKLPTKFAPAERALPEEILRQNRLFAKRKLLGILPNTIPCVLIVVNEHRQIVFANKRLADLLPATQDPSDVLGRRPGEVLRCIHAFETEGGCGTTEFCSTCGAIHAILASQNGLSDVKECRIIREPDGEALEFRVWTTPIAVDGETFTIFAALDISHEKRSQALEHIFLHDIYNVAYGLKWCTDLLKKDEPEQLEEFCQNVRRLSRELIDQIDAQKILIKADSGDLIPQPDRVGVRAVLRDAVALYEQHPVAMDRNLRLREQETDAEIVIDRTLLLRVLCNLLKNALEATKSGQTVTAGYSPDETGVEFWVHNPGVIPREVQLQIFQRSFSTKGAGRGLGAYCIKLLTERYLQGRVSFTSTPEKGTTFRLWYPLVSHT